MPRKEPWETQRLRYMRREARGINFSSGTNRRRNDLIEILAAINNARFDFGWLNCFHLSASDDGATAKIVLKPTCHSHRAEIGQITLEYPSFHNTHRGVFILIEESKAVEIARDLLKELSTNTFAFQYYILLKQGRSLIPIKPI